MKKYKCWIEATVRLECEMIALSAGAAEKMGASVMYGSLHSLEGIKKIEINVTGAQQK